MNVWIQVWQLMAQRLTRNTIKSELTFLKDRPSRLVMGGGGGCACLGCHCEFVVRSKLLFLMDCDEIRRRRSTRVSRNGHLMSSRLDVLACDTTLRLIIRTFQDSRSGPMSTAKMKL
jgi:hypothetical protein